MRDFQCNIFSFYYLVLKLNALIKFEIFPHKNFFYLNLSCQYRNERQEVSNGETDPDLSYE